MPAAWYRILRAVGEGGLQYAEGTMSVGGDAGGQPGGTSGSACGTGTRADAFPGWTRQPGSPPELRP